MTTTAAAPPYRVTDTHAATIGRLTAAAYAADFVPVISWMPRTDRASDSVSLYIGTGHTDGPHREHNVISWHSWTDRLSARPGVPLTLDQVPAYLAAYRDRMTSDRYGIGGDGLDAVYHAVTGRSAYGTQPDTPPVGLSAVLTPAPAVR